MTYRSQARVDTHNAATPQALAAGHCATDDATHGIADVADVYASTNAATNTVISGGINATAHAAINAATHAAPSAKPSANPSAARKANLSTRRRPAALTTRWLLASALALSLTACYTPTWQRLPPSASQADVQAQLGKPREVYPLGQGVTRWLYPTKPFGEETIAADFDAQGRLLRTAQVLSTQEFAKVEIDKWTKTDVLHHFGEPVETSYFPLMKREVWTYRFKQDDVWYSMMNFYFDPEGVVKTTQVSPDPLHEKRDNNMF